MILCIQREGKSLHSIIAGVLPPGFAFPKVKQLQINTVPRRSLRAGYMYHQHLSPAASLYAEAEYNFYTKES